VRQDHLCVPASSVQENDRVESAHRAEIVYPVLKACCCPLGDSTRPRHEDRAYSIDETHEVWPEATQQDETIHLQAAKGERRERYSHRERDGVTTSRQPHTAEKRWMVTAKNADLKDGDATLAQNGVEGCLGGRPHDGRQPSPRVSNGERVLRQDCVHGPGARGEGATARVSERASSLEGSSLRCLRLWHFPSQDKRFRRRVTVPQACEFPGWPVLLP